MKLSMFCIWDDKTKAMLQPFFAPTVGSAVRMLGDAVADPTHGFSKHPEDYTCFRVAEFEDSSGAVTLLEPRETICSLVQLVKEKL